jgi:hypothetical protein
MNNPETQATFGTRHKTKTNKTQNWKLKRWATQTPPKNRWWTQALSNVSEVPVFHKMIVETVENITFNTFKELFCDTSKHQSDKD